MTELKVRIGPDFRRWLEAKGLDPDDENLKHLWKLQAEFEDEVLAKEETERMMGSANE